MGDSDDAFGWAYVTDGALGKSGACNTLAAG